MFIFTGEADFVAQQRPGWPTIDESARRASRLRAALHGATARLAVSQSFAANYERCGFSCTVVENGATRLVSPSRDARTGRLQLCHVGGRDPHKGAFLIEAALRANPYANLAFTLVDLDRTAGHEEHLTWGTTPVTIVGRMQADEMAAFYAQMNVLVAPSTCEESYGLVAREALAQGMWVVVGNRGALHEVVVEGRNGFVVDVADARGVSAALAAMDADPARYAVSPQHPVPERTAEDQTRELVDLYRATLAGKAATTAGV